ncbi:MAG: radical SAM protein [Thermoclostridium sp.]|nr:radical SAM protein [Thermoclostridium sp.]
MKQFKKIYIEITNACNLECDFCPKTTRKLEFMNIDTFGKILEQVEAHTSYVYFHVKGEPLLHPNLDKLLDICHAQHFKVNITTNGTLIYRMKEMLLSKPALRQVNFSLHSFDGNKRMQGKEEYIHNILSFAKEAAGSTNIIVTLRLWNLDENNEILLEREKNNELLRAIEREFDLPYKINEKIMPERGIQITNRVYVNEEHLFQWPDIRLEESNPQGFCYGLRSQAAILVDGTVVPCCLDGDGVINLGNIHHTPFSEIIESERALKLINGFNRREAVEELCGKCGYRKRFG